MPITRFRTFQEAANALRLPPGDPSIARRLDAAWQSAQPILSLAPAPRGIRKFRTIEEAQADRDAWDCHRVEILRDKRNRGA